MATRQQDGKIGADRGSREIYQEIEETRSEMDHTLDEIGERLHPKHLIDEVVALFGSDESSGSSDPKDRARMIGKRLIRKVKQHPMPALLCGGGLAWLLLEDEHHPRQPGMRRQWDDSDEHSGSFVDARTGAPYDASYGLHWRGAAAWNHDFDWSDTHEDEPTWNERAEKTLKEIQDSLSDQQRATRDKIRSSAAKLMTLSGRRRSEIHSQWDEIAEHSGSFVDARTGEPYDDSYGEQWRALVCCDVAASEDWSEEDEQRLSDKAQQSISRIKSVAQEKVPSAEQVHDKAEKIAERAVDTAKQEGQRHVEEVKEQADSR